MNLKVDQMSHHSPWSLLLAGRNGIVSSYKEVFLTWKSLGEGLCVLVRCVCTGAHTLPLLSHGVHCHHEV